MADEADHNKDIFNVSSSRYRQFCLINPVDSLHSAISRQNLTRLDHSLADNNIVAAAPANENPVTRLGNMNCCCGRPNCAYLEHNNAALGGLEKDLETAARLGQVRADFLPRTLSTK